MKYLTIFFTAVLFSSQVFAQGIISSISVFPTNPTVDDNIEVYVDVQFSSGDCALDDSGLGTNGTDITAYAHHCTGVLTVICNTIDTFQVGQLAAGSYTLDFTLSSGFGGPGCSPGIVPDDSEQFQFTVSPSVSVGELGLQDGFAYPIPFSDVLNFKSPISETANLTDINGRHICKLAIGTQRLDVSALKPGVYILSVGESRLKLIK